MTGILSTVCARQAETHVSSIRGNVVGEEYRDLQGMLARLSNARLTRRSLLRYTAVGGVLAGVGPLAAACGGSSTTTTSPSASAAPKQGGSLRIGIVGGDAKESLDGHMATSEPEICNCFQLYDALLGWDADYQMIPLLAAEWSSNTDASVWTVKLRSDVVFHDGSPMTADDVVYSYKRIIDPNDPKMGASQLKGLPSSGIIKVDATTVEFRLDAPNAIFEEAMALYGNCIVPQNFNPKKPIGTGPFKLNTFSPGNEIVYDANTEYWGDGPWVDKVTVIEFADTTARVNALLGGTVDAISQLPAAQVTVVEGQGAKVLNATTGAWQPFTMRIDQKPFDDVRVRQAFRLLVDRKAMIQQALAGYGWEGNDMYAPLDPGTPADLPQRAQDFEQAKSLLKQAGYDGDLAVTLTASDALGSATVSAAQVFAEQAKGAGVTVNVKKIDANSYWTDYLKYTFSQDFWYTRNYLGQTSQGTLPTAPYNETHWKNDQWLAIVEEAFRTGDKTKRNELISAAQTIEHNDGGYIIWAFNNQVDAYSAKLGGVVPNKSGVPLSSFHFNNFFFV
jgi:peptide/nickel transport system substrate-binding protein